MRKITYENLLDTLIDFTLNLNFKDLPADVVDKAKQHLLDSMGCMTGGLKDEGVSVTHKVLEPYMATPWDYAYMATHAIRALDWNDTYLSLEPAHPSDNIGALLAVAGEEKTSGKDFITAMVIAYEIQCRFCDAASLRARGWDHTYYVQIASALACGKLLGLTKEQMRHAVSLAMRKVPLRQVRAGQLSMAKGNAAAEAVREAVWAVYEAAFGATGPSAIIQGEFGMVFQVTGALRLEAFEGFGKNFKLPATYIKLYPVEYHAQAVVELALRLRRSGYIKNPDDIEALYIHSYEQALGIIGGKEKRRPETKESADHSIYYILAVALLDREMTLAQYESSRFSDPKVLELIDKIGDIAVFPRFDEAYKRHEFPVEISVKLKNDSRFPTYKARGIPKGHPRNPMIDKEIEKKFRLLCEDTIQPEEQEEIIKAIKNIEGEIDAGKLI